MYLDKEKLDRIQEEIYSSGKWAVEKQGDLHISLKEDKSVVTEVDITISHRILALIKSLFPDAAIISEEEITEEKDNPPYTFVLDPIDGTDVYSQGFPSFCIALGILDSNKEPVGAMIYAPRFGVGTDEGAFLRLDPEGELLLNGRKFTMKGDKKTVRQLAVSSTCIWKFDFTKYRGKARSLGCSILHILLPVLFPSIAASINEPSFIWDYAAAHAVIRSQGMDLFAPDGSRYVYSSSFLNRERSETPVYGGEKETVEELIKLCPQRELQAPERRRICSSRPLQRSL